MDLFVDGKLNTQAFDVDVRQGTHDLSGVLLATAQTQSGIIESTHFLIAVSKISGGVTQKDLARLGLTVAEWESGLSACAQRSPSDLPPAHIIKSCLHESAAATLDAAQSLCLRHNLLRIGEPVLLLSALRHVTPAVRQLCQNTEIDLENWCEEIESNFTPVEPLPVFNENGELITDSFSPVAKKMLGLMRSETESLGYHVADPRHLLLALLGVEGGVTQYGLYHQGLTPRRIHEAVTLSLRSKAKRTRSTIALKRDGLQPILQHILSRSGELTGSGRSSKIGEPHLLRAFLLVESAARRILEVERVNVAGLCELAEGYNTNDEEDDDHSVADIQTVRERLRLRIVGQDGAIERILPYIQRMRFGFTTPGRPVGVFLFCGQSGSGKTEMAKELARAVYGSEENLIFLEMGQFNSPESMNIFVGAPPGYVGYGEGKLTNGLRDKPRAVVLFDEVEKAHTKVLDALLRFLDEGRIEDPAGPVRDGSECMVVLTSNVGADDLSLLWDRLEGARNWRAEIRKRLRDEFKKHNFRPEFLNRVDEIILFRTLTKADYSEIACRLLKRDLERLRKERQIDVTTHPGVCQEIGAYCAEVSEGARAAQRLTQSVVITPVIDFVLQNSCDPPVSLMVRAEFGTGDPDCEPTGIVEFFNPAEP